MSEQYFGVLRNYRRFGWLVLYLFGTSPAVSKSFFAGREITLPALDDDTVYEPYGTSLRMSDIGYRNKNQATVSVSVNSLDEYVRDLSRAISTPYPPYEKIGVKVDGEYLQLNANILQIENEYYSFIRPKRIARSGERPTKALRRAGVEYVEVRALDVSAFDPVGVNQNKLRFLEAFLALCVLREQRTDQPRRTGGSGCKPSARRAARPRARPQAEPRRARISDDPNGRGELLDAMQGLCEMLDHGEPTRPYHGRSGATARQDRRCRAHALGAPARGDAPERRIVFPSRAAHVENAQGLLPGSVSAQRAPPGGVRRGGARVARGASAASRPPISRTSTPTSPIILRIEASCARREIRHRRLRFDIKPRRSRSSIFAARVVQFIESADAVGRLDSDDHRQLDFRARILPDLPHARQLKAGFPVAHVRRRSRAGVPADRSRRESAAHPRQPVPGASP